ncbi:MFS transporter [Galactobacter caseinivorans]|uniref:MFS transporter n=1 Tax=Galactobacter caseinivorans TaxID=2676123 RepID=A0A496PMY8_9MICC|nr:MFS transporter [Galactobacter caseinivorans]RKW71910.1 MFS transporter [Galactobacter caseinivorans]
MSKGPRPAEANPLRTAAFRGLWLSNAAGDAALMVAMFTTSLVLTLWLHAPAFVVGLVQPLSNAGALIFGLVVGVFVDRWGQRRTMYAAVWARLLGYSLPVFAWALGWLHPWQLLLAVFVASVADTFFRAAQSSLLPVLVGRKGVPDAAAALQASDQVVQLAAPVGAGLLTKLVPAPLVLALSAVGQLFSLLGLRALPADQAHAPDHQHQRILPAIREGLGFFARTPLLAAVMLAAMTNNFAAGLYASAETVFVLRVLGMDPVVFGLLMSVSAVGGILGALLAPRLGRRWGPLRTLFCGATLMPINFALIPLAALWPQAQVAIVGISFVLFGLSLGCFGVSSAGLSAQLTPSRLMARVSSTRRTFTQGAVVLGGLLSAVLSQAFGTLVPLIAAAAISALQFIPLLRVGVPRRGAPSQAELEAALEESEGEAGEAGEVR